MKVGTCIPFNRYRWALEARKGEKSVAGGKKEGLKRRLEEQLKSLEEKKARIRQNAEHELSSVCEEMDMIRKKIL